MHLVKAAREVRVAVTMAVALAMTVLVAVAAEPAVGPQQLPAAAKHRRIGACVVGHIGAGTTCRSLWMAQQHC
jgi:hypothetical protein